MTAGPLASLLLRAGTADRPVASSRGQVIRLQRFRSDVAATASRLATIGCRRGLVACEDAYWATVGWFALAHNGAETVLPSNVLPATLTAMSDSFDHIVTDGAVASNERTLMLAHEDGVSSLPPMDADQARVTLFTSGSTGAPKRVGKTVRQLELEALTVDRLIGETVPASAWVHGTVVHNHLYGLTFRLCWPLATRRAFVGTAHHFWEPLLASMDRGSALVTSPSHLSRLGGLAALPARRRPSAVLSGGAPLPEAAAQASHDVLGCPVREFYGSTEAGVVASRLRKGGEQPPWRPLPGVVVKRVEDGRMQIRSPYLGDIENGESTDRIELDGNGGFLLLGRVDRIVKIEGLRVSLIDFETRLARLEGVAQAAVVVLGGATPYLAGVVVLDSAGQEQLASSGAFRLGRRLRRELAANLPSAALPRRWRFVPKLPTGALGKVSAAELAALFDTL
jgi:acyl-coenzyme A synthetase/AMP-(fatty) acid ligase